MTAAASPSSSSSSSSSYGAIESGTPVGDDTVNVGPTGRQLKTSSFVVSAAAIVAAVVLAVVALSSSLGGGQRHIYAGTAQRLYVFSWDKAAAAAAASLSVTASNEYGVFASREAYPWLDSPTPGSQLVEPYKVTTLAVSAASEDTDAFYVWTIDSSSGAAVETVRSDDPSQLKGASVAVKFTATGIYPLTVTRYDALTGAVTATTTINLVCKYVKRELRTLTEADRDAFLDAAATLWQHTTEEGQALYGPYFTGVDMFTALHIMQSNDIMCDSYHEGSGFLTHHLALTNSFDAALRAVDPSVTLPYWDFTIEGQAIVSAKKTPSYMPQISPVFTATWFGAVDEHSHIVDGRWAHAKIPLAPAGTPRHLQNSFGHWRSFWNNHPDPEVTRHMFEMCGLEAAHKKVPTCLSHFSVLNASSLGAFQMLSPSDGHGPVHIQTGGMYGPCGDAYKAFVTKWADVLTEDMTTEQVAAYGFDATTWGYGLKAPRKNMFEKSIMGEYFHIFRAFWRSHMCAVDATPALLECPDTCDAAALFAEVSPSSTATVDATGSSSSSTTYTTAMSTEILNRCACKVNKLIDGTTTWQNLFPCVVSDTKQDVFNAVMPQELLADMVTMIATSPILHGDMIESSSPADIIFWLIHPGIDRMLSAKRLPTPHVMGDTNYVKWPVVDGSAESWYAFSPYTFGAGENGWYKDAYTCVGHASTDPVLSVKLPLTDAVLKAAKAVDMGPDGNGDGEISNWEYFIAVDPNDVNGNDYVFDHFDWPHCVGKI